MSIEYMTKVWKHSELSGTKLLLLLAIADHANDDGVCWPSIAHLAGKIRLSERQTKRLIQDLVESGELEVGQSCGRGNANTYRVVVARKGDTGDTFSGVKDDIGVTFSGTEKVTSRAQKVTSRARKGDIAMSPQSSRTIIEPSRESSIKPPTEDAEASASRPQQKQLSRMPGPTKPKRPPAVEIYRGVFQRYPMRDTWPRIEEVVGESLDEWAGVCRAWQLQQFNPKNLQGMFDWLQGGIPDYATNNGGGNGRTDAQAGQRTGRPRTPDHIANVYREHARERAAPERR